MGCAGNDAKAVADKATEDARVAVENAKKLQDQAAWQSIYVFSAPAYYELNKARYGFVNPSDYAGLTKHWLEVGMKDGAQGIYAFNIRDYRAANPDIDQMKWPSWMDYWSHWLNAGINEGRPINAEFNARDYLGLYPDLQRVLGATNYPAAYQHWVNGGKAEGRRGRR